MRGATLGTSVVGIVLDGLISANSWWADGATLADSLDAPCDHRELRLSRLDGAYSPQVSTSSVSRAGGVLPIQKRQVVGVLAGHGRRDRPAAAGGCVGGRVGRYNTSLSPITMCRTLLLHPSTDFQNPHFPRVARADLPTTATRRQRPEGPRGHALDGSRQAGPRCQSRGRRGPRRASRLPALA